MTSLTEIEAAITQLSEPNARQLANWLQDYLNDRWDQQIESDFATGKLDSLIARTEAAIDNNNVRSLDEVLRNS
jgi:hypothetical protein